MLTMIASIHISSGKRCENGTLVDVEMRPDDLKVCISCVVKTDQVVAQLNYQLILMVKSS